jgi:hypothetical protein
MTKKKISHCVRDDMEEMLNLLPDDWLPDYVLDNKAVRCI